MLWIGGFWEQDETESEDEDDEVGLVGWMVGKDTLELTKVMGHMVCLFFFSLFVTQNYLIKTLIYWASQNPAPVCYSRHRKMP